MKHVSLLAELMLLSILQACMGNPPSMSQPGSADAAGQSLLSEDAALTVNKAKCTESKMILASVNGAKFTWSTNKGTSTNASTVIPVIGTTDLAGCIYPQLQKNADGNAIQSLTGGTANFDFRPTTTNSFSVLRDNRIIQYIFGYDLANDPEGSVSNSKTSGLLKFTMAGVTGNDLIVPTNVGDAISVKVAGTLQIAGFSVPVEVPVALTKTDFGYNVTNNDRFTLNIRGGNQSLNTLGLDQRVAEILALVANATLQDLVDIKFSIDLVDLCG